MKRLQHWVLVWVASFSLLAAAETNAPKTFRFTGTVVDAAGQPVAGATVECHQYGPFQCGSSGSLTSPNLELKLRVTTGGNGVFEFQLQRTMTYLLAQKPGLAPAWKQWTPTRDLEGQLVLTPTTVLAGIVVDEAGKPVPAAEISVRSAGSAAEAEGGQRSYAYLAGKLARSCFSTRSGNDGRFRIEGFPTNAAADLAVIKPGKVLREPDRDRVDFETMRCRAGQQEINLVLEPGSSIEGKVAGQDSGQPVAGMHLRLEGDRAGVFQGTEDVRSGADGTFRFDGIGGGSYRIRAFGTNALPDWIAEAVPVSVEAGQAKRDVQIIASRGGFLEVSVLAKGDRKPLAQARVDVFKSEYRVIPATEDNGIALLRLPPGEYQVSANKEGWRSGDGATSASVEAGKTNSLEIELAPPPRISGVVRRPDGQPAAKLSVRIVGGYSPEEAKNTTDADGKFDFEWNPQRYGSGDMTYCLLIRDAERNLAVAQEVNEETGPLDLRLAPALTLVGQVECDGKPVTNAGAALVFWSGNRGMHLSGLATGTNIPGHFEIPAIPPGRKYGLYVSAPGYGQKYVSEVDSPEAKRLELDPVELQVANLKLGGQVLDAEDKPVAGANVHLYGDGQPQGNARTDREGRFRFEKVCAGSVRLSANARNSYGNTVAEGGDTNVVLRLGESYSKSASSKPSKVKGTVTGPDGKPVVGAVVEVFPSEASRRVKTDARGAFDLTWTLQSWQAQSGGALLVVRDTAKNLAAAEDLSEETTNLVVKLEPALTLTGRVEGPDGGPLTNAQVGVWLLASRSYSQVGEQLAAVDAQGRFEIKALPNSQNFTVFAKAKGHGRSQQKLDADTETNRLELEPFVLKLADQVLAGQVVNPDDKPVSGANVSLSGEDQPEGSATTDSKGRFKIQVCEGQVRLFASSQTGYANTTAEAGDTNVILQLAPSGSSSRQTARRPALKGKPLPDLSTFGFSANALPSGKPVLLCVLDVEQRPSRRMARLLAEQHDALRQKGIAVLAIQAPATSPDSLDAWKGSNPVPFPIGRVAEKSEKNRWAATLTSLPWLILSDAQGRVSAEGFPFDELDEKLQALAK